MRLSGYSIKNSVRKGLEKLINQGILNFLRNNFPTFYARNSSTTPDIILTEKKVYYNTIITELPITTSDHIPVILKITANAITQPSPQPPDLKNANWEFFKDTVDNTIISKINN